MSTEPGDWLVADDPDDARVQDWRTDDAGCVAGCTAWLAALTLAGFVLWFVAWAAGGTW